MSLATSTRHKLALLGALYLSQGLPYGFFVQTLPVLMREQGYALSTIGLVSLLGMPWSLKFLWAPIVDAHGSPRIGHRKSWILPLQLATAGLMLGLAFTDPSEGLLLVFIGFFFASLFAATQDIATDGLAVETLQPHERGLGNGVQVAGYRFGMILGGGVLLIVYDALGWRGSFIAMAALLLAALVPVLRHREPPRPASTTGDDAPHPSLLDAVRDADFRTWLGVLLVYKSGEALATGMLRPFLKDQGLALSDIGWLLGTGGFVAGLLGALFGGYLTGRISSRRRALLLLGGVQAVAVASYALPAAQIGGGLAITLTCIAEHFASGAATAALFTAMMDRCDPSRAATDYTLQASAVVIATGTMAVASGFIAELTGYLGLFLIATALCFTGLALVALLVKKTPAAAP